MVAENVEQKSLHKIRRTHKIRRIFAQNPPDQLGTMVYTMVYTIVSTRLKLHFIADTV
jgi:hypothetical protein